MSRDKDAAEGNYFPSSITLKHSFIRICEMEDKTEEGIPTGNYIVKGYIIIDGEKYSCTGRCSKWEASDADIRAEILTKMTELIMESFKERNYGA